MPRETRKARIPLPVGQYLEDQPAFQQLVEEGWRPLFARTKTDANGEQYALVDLVRAREDAVENPREMPESGS